MPNKPKCKIRMLGNYIYWGYIILTIVSLALGCLLIIDGFVIVSLLFCILPGGLMAIYGSNNYLITTTIDHEGFKVRGLTKTIKQFNWDEITELGIGYVNLGIITAYLYCTKRSLTEYELMDILRLNQDEKVIVFKLNEKALKTIKYYYQQPIRNE